MPDFPKAQTIAKNVIVTPEKSPNSFRKKKKLKKMVQGKSTTEEVTFA